MRSVTEVIVIGAGQSGLAAARALQAHSIRPVVLEAGPEPAGAWPDYYDSLTLFSRSATAACPAWTSPATPAATRTATRSSPTYAATPPPWTPTSAPAPR